MVGYFNKWRCKLIDERKVTQFAELMERKTRTAMKNVFALRLFRKCEEEELL
jgi:hypothetical protein